MISQMPRAIFENSFKLYREKEHIVVEESALQIEGRPIELWRLYVEVGGLGGPNAVTKAQLWPVVGGHLGFVQFPESNDEPAKSGPSVALHLHDIYSQYLAGYNKTEDVPLQDTTSMGGLVQQPSSSRGSDLSDFRDLASRIGVSTPQQLNTIAQLSTMSISELQLRQVPQEIISVVEANRPLLQASLRQQTEYLASVTLNPQSGPPTTDAPWTFSPLRPVHDAGPAFTPKNVPRGQQGSSHDAVHVQNIQQAQAQVQTQIRVAPKPDIPAKSGRYPTKAELSQGRVYIAMLKQEYIRPIQVMPPRVVDDADKRQYNALFDKTYQYNCIIEPNLHLYACFFSDHIMRRLTAAAMTINHQRQLAEAGQPKYLLTLENLRKFFFTMEAAYQSFPYGAPSTGSRGSPQPPPSGSLTADNTPPAVSAPGARSSDNVPQPAAAAEAIPTKHTPSDPRRTTRPPTPLLLSMADDPPSQFVLA